MSKISLFETIAWDNRYEALREALAIGADINEIDELEGVTPLHYLVDFVEPDPKSVQLFIDSNADVNAEQRKTKRTPLHRAAAMNSSPIICETR